MLAVNYEYMCRLFPKKGDEVGTPNLFNCVDMEAVDRQIQAALTLESDFDAASGGTRNGWYRIAKTPDEARAVIIAVKRTVVPGIEVDYLFGSYQRDNLWENDASRQVNGYFDQSARYIFPIHFSDNLFGGAAYQNSLKTAGPVGLAGRPVGIGTDFNGFNGLGVPALGRRSVQAAGLLSPGDTAVNYLIATFSGQHLQKSRIGDKEFDINTDGVAHAGMLPDLVAHFSAMGMSNSDPKPLQTSRRDSSMSGLKRGQRGR